MREKLTMLIVDDVGVNRTILRETFQATYNIVEAKDGVEALEALHRQKIDIVILDLFMPRLNGVGVLKQMKLETELSSIPVVVKTAVDENMEEEILKMGADEFIFSPFDTAVVAKRVNNIVQKYILTKMVMQREMEEEKRLSKVKQALIAGISEQLKEPIQKIMKLAERDLEVAESLPLEDRLEQIKLTTEKMLTLVDDILDISGETTGKAVLKKEVFHLNTIVSTIAQNMNRKCKEKGIHFEFDLWNVVREELIGDVAMLRTIWIGTLENSIQNTAAGGSIRTVLQQRMTGSEEVELIINIQDEGGERGFPQIRSMVELLGGKLSIQFSGEEHVDIILRITYPCKNEEPKKDKKFNSMKIMFFDEDEITCNYHVASLTRLGIQCEVAENSVSALNKMREYYEDGAGYDCCFVNWDMENGKAIIQKIRENFSQDMLLIVASTSQKDIAEADMLKAGVDYILVKPLLQSTVYQLMTQICQKLN